MRKTLALLALTGVASLSACGGGDNTNDANGNTNVSTDPNANTDSDTNAVIANAANGKTTHTILIGYTNVTVQLVGNTNANTSRTKSWTSRLPSRRKLTMRGLERPERSVLLSYASHKLQENLGVYREAPRFRGTSQCMV